MSDGICFRLVPESFYKVHFGIFFISPRNWIIIVDIYYLQKDMSTACISELLSSPLENMILKAKLLDMGKPEAILALAMEKPRLSAISHSIYTLKECGALLRTCDNAISDTDGDITFIGQIMADLPLDVKLTKLVIFGYCFSVLSECVIIGKPRHEKYIKLSCLITNTVHFQLRR